MKKWKLTKRERDKLNRRIAFIVFRLSPATITLISTIGAILNITWTEIAIAILGASTIFIGEVSGILKKENDNEC